MSRKYNAEKRLMQAYNNYMIQLGKRTAVWMSKGYMPVDPKALSYEDYKANREYLKSIGIAPGNVTSKLISSQLYAFDQKKAKALQEALAETGSTEKFTLNQLKANPSAGLSALNEALKIKGESGTDRAAFITEQVYGGSE